MTFPVYLLKGISMKALLAVTTLFFALNASAWTGTKCSNSDGSVNWEMGYQENLINLKYSNFVEGILTLETEKVNIQFVKDVTLKEKTFRGCGQQSMGRIFAGEVKITASDKTPDVLRSQFPGNKVQTAVICTTIVSNAAPCMEEMKP